MKLLNFKKATCAVGILFVALYAQQAFAWGYLYCATEPWYPKDWTWAVITDRKMNVDPQFSDLAYVHKGYVVINGDEEYDQSINNFALKVTQRTPLMTKEETTAFCQEIKTFCPEDKPFVLTSQWKNGQPHWIRIPRQVSPEQPNDHVYEVCS